MFESFSYYLNVVFQCLVLESKDNEDKENLKSTLASRETQISDLTDKVMKIYGFYIFSKYCILELSFGNKSEGQHRRESTFGEKI